MDDQTRALALRSMQLRASGLLVLAAIVFVVASIYRDFAIWVPYVRAFAEAAMIGGLADWFAVTALFRHPLGLPIPHTAIIPARKDRIAESFGYFVERNFLNPDRIAERIRRQDPAIKLAQWLRQPKRARQVADLIAESLSGILRVANDDDVGQLIARGLNDRLGAIPATPLIGRLLGAVVADQRRQEVLVQIVGALSSWVQSNEDNIRRRIAGELPTWVPRIVDQKIYERLIEGLQRTLNELRENPDHPLYEQFARTLDHWVVNLQFDPEVRERGEAIKADLLAQPMLREVAASVWTDLKAALLTQAAATDSPLRRSIELGMGRMAEVLEHDPEWRVKIDNWAESAARVIINRYGRSAGEFVTQTIRGWDVADTSRRIELQIGRDLQFIRINGTIVGGLAGLVIYSLSQFFGA
ncbi:MAG: DUF445 domain-containing protein [Oscillochloris sp.]|nr:DUF445 domain-containing protein [Oscillochloris sp.]